MNKDASKVASLADTYRKLIQRLVFFFVRRNQPYTGMVLGALLSEPWQNIKGSLVFVLGRKKNFCFYGLNPKTITKMQAQLSPVLLLHGDYHNQSAWLNFAKTTSNRIGALFTVNLPSGDITAVDFQIVEEKIQEIKSLYTAHGVANVQVQLIGHSRGGDLAYQITWRSAEEPLRKDISKMVKIGSVLTEEEIKKVQHTDPMFFDRIYEITGRQDVLEPKKSLLPSNQYSELDLGHLGLLYSKASHEVVASFCLSENEA